MSACVALVANVAFNLGTAEQTSRVSDVVSFVDIAWLPCRLAVRAARPLHFLLVVGSAARHVVDSFKYRLSV